MRRVRIAAFCAATVIAAGSAQAALVQPFGIGARAASMGEAVSANVTDPFAVYYNPAGLTNIDRPMLSAGTALYDATMYYKNFKVEDADGNQVSRGENITRWPEEQDLIIHPYMGFAMPLSQKWSLGVAAYAPYGFHVEMEKNPVKNPMATFSYESLYGRMVVTPTAAYKFSDKLSVGFGVSLGKSVTEAGKTLDANPFQALAVTGVGKKANLDTYNAALQAGKTQEEAMALGQKAETAAITALAPLIDTNKADGSYLNDFRLDMEDEFNWSWNVGVQYVPSDKLSLGLTYRSRAEGDFKGDVLFNGDVIGTAAMDYDHPDSVQAGIRYAFTDKLAASFDMVWCNWDINKTQDEYINFKEMPGADKILQAAGITPGSEAEKQAYAAMGKYLASKYMPKSYNRDWESQIQYKLGVEYFLNDMVTLRGGYVYDPTPVPDETFDNGWPDTDRHSMNIGAGLKLNENWSVDLSLHHIRTFDWGYRDIEGESENLNGGFSGPGEENTVTVSNQGYLWGSNITINYAF